MRVSAIHTNIINVKVSKVYVFMANNLPEYDEIWFRVNLKRSKGNRLLIKFQIRGSNVTKLNPRERRHGYNIANKQFCKSFEFKLYQF